MRETQQYRFINNVLNSLENDASMQALVLGRMGLRCLRAGLVCVFLLAGLSQTRAQTAITTITTTTASSVGSVKNVTAPADAVVTVKAYDVTYGTGNLEPLLSFAVGGSTYGNLINPDTVILQRQFIGDEQLTIFYSRTSFNDVPTTGTIGIETTGVVAADSLYLLSAMNAGLTNILSNVDDVSAGFEVEIERVDYIWFEGIQTLEPTLSAFPIFDLDGNDNVAIAAITSLDANGEPASYGQIVGIGDNVWTGGNINIGDITVFRQETAALDNIPFQNFTSQNVEGIAVTFDDLGIGTSESFFGYSLFAPDVVNGFSTGNTLGAGPHTPAAGIDLTDISTFPDDTPRSDAGLDLIISSSAAASVNDVIIETIGPGGYKAALTTWLKANEGITTATDGSNVTLWEDQWLGENDAQTSVASEPNPVYRNTSSTINFNPTVDFGSVAGSALRIADNGDFNTTNGPWDRKGFNLVVRTGDDISSKQVIYEQGGDTRGFNVYINNNTLFYSGWNRGGSDGFGSPWGYSFQSVGISADTEYIITFEYDGDDDATDDLSGEIRCYLNGNLIGTITGVGLLYNHGDDIGIGDEVVNALYDNGAGGFETAQPTASFDGEISEFIYCNEPAGFTLAQRQKTASYLAIKYGITLDQSTAFNYVNSDENIIFNTGDPAAIGGYFEYNNDIAGIGRDDASELIQLKSKSENANSILTIERAGSIGNNNTWMLWGNDGASTAETDALTMPDTINMRISRVWRVAETNEVGNTSVTFDLNELGLTGKSASDLSLLVAGNGSNAGFGTATVISGGLISGTDITFSGVNLADGQYITLGTEYFLCSPGGVDTDLYVWLRADIDAFNTGTTQATDGQTVATWADQSLSSIDATEDGNAPQFKNNTTDNINFNPTIDFDGVNDRLDLGNLANIKSGAVNGGDYTLVTVGTRQSSGNTQYILGSPGGTGNQDLHFGYRTNTVATIAHWGNDLNVTVSAFDSPEASPFLLTAEYNGVNRIVEETRSGSFARSTESESTDLSGTRTNYVGDVQSLANYNGLISEIIVFDNDITGLQKQQVYTYLAIKYGITLTNDADNDAVTNEIISGSIREGDYVSSDGTTVIWTYANNATYHNDVAGIGRDDASCFEQKQSTSANNGNIVTMGLGTIAADNSANMNSFTDDGDFLVWGNDDNFADQANANVADLPGNVTERMERIWKVEDTGTVGATEISFDLTGLGYGTTLSDFQLIISNTATMASGSVTPAASYDGGTNTVTFSNIDLTDGQFFTLGTNRSSCSPGGVDTGLYVWLRADVESYNTGTTQATDGQTVATWVDQSGTGTDATTDGTPPIFRSNTTNNINFNPTLDFDGTDDRLSLGNLVNVKSGAANGGDYTLIAAGLREDNTSGYVIGSTAGTTNQELFMGYRTNTQATTGQWGNDFNLTVTEFDNPTAPFLLLAEYDGSGRVLEETRDGSFGRATDSNTTDVSGSQTSFVGNLGSGATRAFDGLIPEVIIFDNDITDLQEQQVNTYLAIKYGVTLTNDNDNDAITGETISGSVTEGDYVFSDGTTVLWDFSANSSYHNDVAGIGRDDASCFSQKQSRAEDTDDILTIGLGTVAADNASNANSFTDNGDYLIWGNDNGATTEGSKNTVDVPGNVSERMTRVWRVQDNGTVGDTEIQFDLAGTGFTTGDATPYSLLVSDSPTMASASVVVGGSFNGDVLSFTGVDLTDGQYFTIGTDFETCGPGGVNTNIALWLAADKETFSDAGTTATVNLDGLQQWNDQSAPASNASEVDLEGVGPVLPVYRTEEFNFNPVIRFADPNSTNASFMRNTTNTVTGDFTLISVFKSGQSDGTSDDFVNSPALIGADDDASNSDYGLGIENGRVLINANDNTGTDAETTTLYNDDRAHFALATRVQSSGAVEIFVDSESAATGTGSTTALTGPASFGIGNHSDPNVNAQFSGDIAETIVFNQALNENERTRVESYLAIKYGITRVVTGLSETAEDYLAGDGGIIWDIDAQGLTYHNDIFGIGRDDLSCFEQIKSKSENSDALVTIDNNGSFASDDAWLISGNDNAVIEAEGNNERPSAIKSRLNREWRVQETGSVGTVRLSYDLSTVTGPSGVGTNNLNQTRLMVDDDGNFSSGVTLISPVAVDGTNDIVTFEVDFTSGQYYTLGSIEVAALPITLISFEVSESSQGKVKLDWTTASEVNNAFYTIERSTNGVDFEVLTSLDGAGNSSDLLFYTYTDTKPINGLSFYRLKQTDFSGEFTYSEIRSVRVTRVFEASYSAYPNPIRQGETLKISYQIDRDQQLLVTVLNLRGQVVIRERVEALVREDYIELSTSKFQKGINLVRILDENQQLITLKILVR